MKITVIQVGNSKGILLSKTLLERYGIGEKIELTMKEEHIELRPVNNPREGWEEAFKEMHEMGDDQLIIPSVLPDDVIEDWDWDDDSASV
jgi:antitoxin MazE